jgi:hypothetical protein
MVQGLMGRIDRIGKTKRTYFAGIIIGLACVLSVPLLSLVKVHAEGVNCDANAVVTGGVASVSALQQKYNNGTSCVSGGVTYSNKAYSIQDIYHGFNIGPSDISGMGADTENGYVTRSGDVYAGGKLVATNAMTAGRQDYGGATTHHYGATTYYERTPNQGFAAGVTQLDALVVMKNGVFQFAIFNSCGNPVSATPVPQPKPKPPTPTYSCVSLTGAVVDQTKMLFTFTATASVGGGAVFKDAVLDFGDGKTQTLTPAAGKLTVTTTHQYAAADSYNAAATLYFTANGATVSAKPCPLLVPVSGPPVQECKPGVPMGSPECTPCPYDTSLPSNSPQCIAPPPPSLPNTGAGDTIAIFSAVAVAGFLVYRQLIFRKHRAAFLAAEQGTSPLPLQDPLDNGHHLHFGHHQVKRPSLRRKRPY